MDRNADGEGSESRFASYVEHMASTLGHADRRTPFRSYCTGLILPGERKSVEPIAARVEPRRVQGAHQSLHHFVANADWSQEDLLRRVRTFVLPAIEKSGRIRAWIVDDTGFPKKGVHSVGVARQYCGQLGKQDNCQIAVSLSVANEHASLPIAFRLYLPEDWAADPVRRARAGVPEDVVFKTKPQIALDQIKAARAEGVPEGVVLADAGYGINTAFRTALTRMGLTYVVGVQSSARLWPPGAGPLPPKAWSGQGRPPTLMRRDAQNKPQSAEQLAKSLSADAWRDVAWREGVDKTLHSRFAVLRVRPAHRDYWRSQPYPEEWLLVEWPQGESAPTKYWLSTLPADTDPRNPRCNRQTALADRARLSGTQAGTRPRSLRRTRLARLSPPHGALRRGLRIPGLRTKSDSPLRRQNPASSRRLAYPRVIDPADPPIRAERHIKASIATIRIKLARNIARRLPRCPCCQRANL